MNALLKNNDLAHMDTADLIAHLGEVRLKRWEAVKRYRQTHDPAEWEIITPTTEEIRAINTLLRRRGVEG